MFKTILPLALVAVSFSTFAAEKCTIQGYGSIFKSNGAIYKDVKVTDVKTITREKNWAECYKEAVRLSKKYDSTIGITVSGRRVQGGSADTNLFFYLSWSFDDSYIPLMDTSGKITTFTDKFESYPLDGDLRYFRDGTLFK